MINSKDRINKIARNSELLLNMSEDNLRRKQMLLLDMYRDVKRICDKNQISLFLIGGSALGAVRHHGFIPWDDDMDLAMTRQDYSKFTSIFEVSLGNDYILNAPNYSSKACHKYPRILKKDSYYRAIIDTNIEELHCIYLDLFIIENTPNNLIHRYLKGIVCNFFYIASWEVFIWENNNSDVKAFLMRGGWFNYYIRLLIGFIFSFRKSEKWFDLFDKLIQYNNNKSDCCCLATGRKRYFGEIMQREQWFPGVEADFEGEKVLLFQDLDYYLRNLYGDYMQIPPLEKRERHNACEIYFSREEMERAKEK